MLAKCSPIIWCKYPFRSSFVCARNYVTNVLTSPTAKIQLRTRDGVISVEEVFRNKKVLLVGVVGAFTSACTQHHTPSYIKLYDDIRKKKIDLIAVTTVNDIHVTKAWAQSMPGSEKLLFLADPDASFAKSIGQTVDLTMAGLGLRSKRYAMLIDNGTPTITQVEASPGDVKVSSAESILEQL